MTIPDMTAVGAISGLAVFSGWIIRRITDSYFDHVSKQTPILIALAKELSEHEERAAEAHRQAAECHQQAAVSNEQTYKSLKEMTQLLVAINKANGNGTRR